MTGILEKCKKTSGTLSVIHLNAWNQDKHGAAFLKPIIQGFMRRLESEKTADSGGDKFPGKY